MIVGTGTYGTVDLTDQGEILKKIPSKWFSIYLREVFNLIYLNKEPNTNVVGLKEFSVLEMNIKLERGSEDIAVWLKKSPTSAERGKVISYLLLSVWWLHRMKIVHADLKLSNVIYVRSTDSIRLIDFGFSGLQGWAHNTSTTPAYADPNKEDGFGGDVYSLGLMLTELLTGIPFAGKPSSTKIKDSLQLLGPEHRKIISKMISLKKKRPSMDDVCISFGLRLPVFKRLWNPNYLVQSLVQPTNLSSWIQRVLKLCDIKGPFAVKDLEALVIHLGREKKYVQFHAAALLSIYGSFYRGNVNLSTMISICPTKYSRSVRKYLLLNFVEEFLKKDLVIHCILHGILPSS